MDLQYFRENHFFYIVQSFRSWSSFLVVAEEGPYPGPEDVVNIEEVFFYAVTSNPLAIIEESPIYGGDDLDLWRS